VKWVMVSNERRESQAGCVEYLRVPFTAFPPGWYGHRWDALEYCAGPCATAEEAMRAVEAAVGQVA
jgi:hypothetical protein